MCRNCWRSNCRRSCWCWGPVECSAGFSLKQASGALRGWLAEHQQRPTGGTWRIAVCGPHWAAHAELGPDFAQPTWDPAGADFAMSLGTFYCATLDAPVIAEIVREGV